MDVSIGDEPVLRALGGMNDEQRRHRCGQSNASNRHTDPSSSHYTRRYWAASNGGFRIAAAAGMAQIICASRLLGESGSNANKGQATLMINRRETLKSVVAAGVGAAGAAKASLAAMASEIVTLPFANGERPLVAYPASARSFG